MSDTPEDDRAATSVDVDATPDEVWEALTTDDGLATWFGEGSGIGDEPGDSLYVLDPITEETKTGIVETVVPVEQIDFTWWPLGEPDDASHVSITLQPSDAGTRVTVTERPLRPGTAVMSANSGRRLATAGRR